MDGGDLDAERLLQDCDAELARRSLYEFGKQAWHIIEPGNPFEENWHHGAIAEHLEAVARGEIQLLRISQPPGTMKSVWTAVFWPAWVWTWWPEWRAIFTSHKGPLATRDSMKCREIIRSAWYRRAFMEPGRWEISASQDEKTEYWNTRMGVRQAFGIGGGGTGFRGNCVTVDDPHDVLDAHNKADHEKVQYWWSKVMSSRLNDPRTDARVIVGQRVHENDLSGYVERMGGYQHLVLAAEYNPKRSAITFRKDGSILWEDPRTEDGELLHPERLTAEVLEQQKRELGSDYEGQYNQSPTPAGGGLFKASHWRFWKPDGTGADVCPRPKGCWDGPARPLPRKFDEILISVDCTFKDKKSSDYVVMLVIGKRGADRFVLDRVRGRMSFSATVSALRELVKAWPQARRRLIEDTANGPAVIDTLKSEISGLLPRSPKASKEERAHVISPQVESGNVFLPDGAPWLDEWVAEFTSFPRGLNDDQVDALTQGLIELSESSLGSRLRQLMSAEL